MENGEKLFKKRKMMKPFLVLVGGGGDWTMAQPL